MKKMYGMIMIFLVVLVTRPLFSQSETEGTEPPKPIKEWREVAGFGEIKIVYMSRTGLEDHEYIGKFLKQIVKKNESLTVWIFDTEAMTPHTLPFTDDQKRHWKAQYRFDPENKRETFAFTAPIDPKAIPVELKETKTDIGTGYFGE